MPTGEMRGITVRIDAELHAEIKAYLEAHEMTMGEFIALAAENELHPKIQEKESKSMENMRTLAFQVPEDLFQRIKDYLRRNNMTQKQLVIGLIEDELERDEALHQGNAEEETADEDMVPGQGEDVPGQADSGSNSEKTDLSENDEDQEDFSDEESDVSADDFECDEDEEDSEEEEQEHSPEM